MVPQGVHLRLIAIALTALFLSSSATYEDHWWLADLGFSEVAYISSTGLLLVAGSMKKPGRR